MERDPFLKLMRTNTTSIKYMSDDEKKELREQLDYYMAYFRDAEKMGHTTKFVLSCKGKIGALNDALIKQMRKEPVLR